MNNSIAKIIKSDSLESHRTPNGQTTILLDAQDTGGRLALAQYHFLPGQGETRHNHSEKDEMLLVESGNFHLSIGADTFALKAGDFALLPHGVEHAFSCTSDEPGTLFCWTVEAGEQAATPKVVRAGEGECLEAFGDTMRVLASTRQVGVQYFLAEDETPSLGGPPLHLHEQEDELFLVRAGHYEFCLNDARVLAEPGDVVFAPRGIPHTFRAVSAEPGRQIVMTAPGSFGDFFRASAQVFETGEATPEAIMEIGARHGIRFLPPTA